MKKIIAVVKCFKALFSQIKLEIKDLSLYERFLIFLVIFVNVMVWEVNIGKLLRIVFISGSISLSASYFVFLKNFFEENKKVGAK